MKKISILSSFVTASFIYTISNDITTLFWTHTHTVTEAESQSKEEHKKHIENLRKTRNITKEKQFFDDIDVTGMEHINCGRHKCFIPSKTSPNEFGYLVTSLNDHPYFDQTLAESYEAAQWIENELGGKTLYHKDPPFVVEMSKDMQKEVNEKGFNFQRNALREEESLGSRTIVVKKAIKAPEDSLFLGCFFNKMGFNFQERLEDFSERVCMKHDNYNIENNGVDVSTFTKNLNKSVEITRKVFQQRPWIMYDFQAMIDTSGNLNFFDLEAHRKNPYKKFTKRRKKNKCLKQIKNVGKQIETMCGS